MSMIINLELVAREAKFDLQMFSGIVVYWRRDHCLSNSWKLERSMKLNNSKSVIDN